MSIGSACCGYMTRSAMIHWGLRPAAHVAGMELLIDGGRRIVSWPEVLEARRKRQRDRMAWLRRAEAPRACKVEVAYYDQELLGGWQTMLYSLSESIWVERYRYYIPELMSLFPLTLLGWEDWKLAFARAYARRRQDARPVGVRYLWMYDRRLSLESPSDRKRRPAA